MSPIFEPLVNVFSLTSCKDVFYRSEDVKWTDFPVFVVLNELLRWRWWIVRFT